MEIWISSPYLPVIISLACTVREGQPKPSKRFNFSCKVVSLESTSILCYYSGSKTARISDWLWTKEQEIHTLYLASYKLLSYERLRNKERNDMKWMKFSSSVKIIL